MAKFILIVVLGGMFTFGISNISQNNTVTRGTQNVVDNFAKNRAHDIATSMSDVIMTRIANDVGYRAENEQQTEPLYDGDATYIVEDSYFDGDSLIKIIVAGEFNGAEKIITTFIEKPSSGWVPTVVRGAWTANGNLNNTISDMYIDGRDHDLDQNIIPTTGIFGISTSTTFENVSNAEIGGTNNFVDYPMTFPEVPQVIEEYFEWEGGFPESPDEILGYPEGTLESAAKSGEYGSQYIINPPEVKVGKKMFIDGLSYPLSGVTYIEINNGHEYELQLEQNGNSGIVVIHNSQSNSRVKGIKYNKETSDGVLTGLLVTDYSFHHHIDILGSIMMLSPDLETEKSCQGNLDHWAFYSSEAIENATEIAAKITGLVGKTGYGFGRKRVNIMYVYE
ncbi:hypothetical protein ACFLSH_00750 [Bacteroidota bacterium]